MPKQKPGEVAISHKVGDRVKIKNYAGKIGRIVEERGPLGPGRFHLPRARSGQAYGRLHRTSRRPTPCRTPPALNAKLMKPARVATKPTAVTEKPSKTAKASAKTHRIAKAKTPASK